MASNLPPGCNPNDPHLTGQWPVHQVADDLWGRLDKVNDEIEDIVGEWEDQIGELSDVDGRAYETVIETISHLKSELERYIE